MQCPRCGENMTAENRVDFPPEIVRMRTGLSDHFTTVKYRPQSLYRCPGCDSEWEWIKGFPLILLGEGAEVHRLDVLDYSVQHLREAFGEYYPAHGLEASPAQWWPYND